MKHTYLYLLLVLVTILASCQRDPELPIKSLSVKEQVQADFTQATISGAVSTNTRIDTLYLQLCTDEAFSALREIPTTYQNGQFNVNIESLSPHTLYYYRFRSVNALNTIVTPAVCSFRTRDCEPIRFSTFDIQLQNSSSVRVTCSFNKENCGPLRRHGVQYWVKSSTDTVFVAGADTILLTGLNQGYTYEAHALATNLDNITYYSKVKEFTTTTVPSVTTIKVLDIDCYKASCMGDVTDAGGLPITERGICYSSTTATPTTSDACVKTTSAGVGQFTCTLEGLITNTTYYARAYATNAAGTAYGAVLSFKTYNDAHKAVDLGLSVKWAETNIGATADTDFGMYLAWGELAGKTTYSWPTYTRLAQGSQYTMTKYCTSTQYGRVDNKTQLEAADDAATYSWSDNWHTPTAAEWQELVDNCKAEWVQRNSVLGCRFTSNINGNSIFLPAAGGKIYPIGVKDQCYYWTSSLSTYSNEATAYIINNNSKLNITSQNLARCSGFSVRAVRP